MFFLPVSIFQGKVKPVTERSGIALKDLLEPTPNFDCHISRSFQSLNPNSSHFQVFEYSQVSKNASTFINGIENSVIVNNLVSVVEVVRSQSTVFHNNYKQNRDTIAAFIYW